MNRESQLAAYGLSEEIIADVLRLPVAAGETLIDRLIQRKDVSETALLEAMGARLGIPFWPNLPSENLGVGFTKSLSIQYLRRQKMVPLETPDGTFVAVNDPSKFQSVDDILHILDWKDARIVLSTQTAILSAINFAYDQGGDSAEEFIQDMNEEESPDSIISEIEETADLLDDTSDAPIIRLVNLTLSRAVKDRASDIHIEPYQNSLVIRYRIDGVLYNILKLPKRIQSSLISRVKVMAKLNIAEKRLPQDGRIDIKIGDKAIDIRVSVIPTAFGERAVLRLLDKTGTILKLSDLGMHDDQLATFNELIKSPYGIILVTGPTGSGKTTTLYAALSTINSPEINIITIEDPIEYQIEGIGQIQVNPKIDLTFAKGLRSIVRQDPDVILVGEIRDKETSEIAIQSSLTGHLVFSTLHTNDAASAITRMTDMDVEPFLVSSSVIAIIAQRLVRVLCPQCREAYAPDDKSLMRIGIDKGLLQDHTIYRKKGCPACMNTGYKGRTAIFEMMVLDDHLKKLILKTSDSNQILREAIKSGMTTMLHDGSRKVLEGITTIEEVFRVTRM
ncbi:MAG TPA: type II secretion system ATPase GspE [Syntrophales bacterium]|nr:type II secretion system ATPase GspE [Syntrophales bacterium]HPQ43900.1 type II secretion system ATPase GspE [Syntrophales bacterium]